MIDHKIKIAKILNKYFVNFVKNLGILTGKESAAFAGNYQSKVEMALKKHKNLASINAITQRMKILGNFTLSFNIISRDDTVKELNKLKSKNASQKTDIPIKIVKKNANIITHIL